MSARDWITFGANIFATPWNRKMKLNTKSIKTRLLKLEQFINELEKQQTISLPNFESTFTTQLAVERAFQAATESCIDIAAHIVATYKLGHPKENRDVFKILAEHGYLSPDFGQAMMDMVGLRNRIVHLYWDVDVKRLYDYLQENVILLKRFRDFTYQILQAEDNLPTSTQ